jgi:methionine-S-sulfoxide reductase
MLPVSEEIYLAGGCFWGLERILSALPGVIETSVGYMGGHSENPTYVQVCTGTTGHAETVKVTFDSSKTSTTEICARFFENHDPTQKDGQGNDLGTQYRSAIWVSKSHVAEAVLVKSSYQKELTAAGKGEITTEIQDSSGVHFWPAEEYHQKYLEKNPLGYCNHGFNGVACPSGVL